MGKSENYGTMLSIMRRHCKECRVEGKHRLHTMMGGEDCADCCVPEVIAIAMAELSMVFADDEERMFLFNVAMKQIEKYSRELEKEEK